MSRDYSRESEPHRVLKLDHLHDWQRGADVLALQHAVNRRLRARGLDRFLVHDDDAAYGEDTALACRKAVWALGGMVETIRGITTKAAHGEGALSVGSQKLIRFPGTRVDAQLDRSDARHDEIIAAAKRAGVRINGNRVTGGSPHERLKAAAEHAAWRDRTGRRHSFYNQRGAYTVAYGITGEPRGYRSDCSQWVTSIYRACGLSDPNGADFRYGNTGTLGQHGRAISVSQLRPGDLILYGYAPYHHVEMFVGPGQRTIGHGSRPVDAGWINQAPGVHCRSYV
jgi:hypothetical protein